MKKAFASKEPDAAPEGLGQRESVCPFVNRWRSPASAPLSAGLFGVMEALIWVAVLILTISGIWLGFFYRPGIPSAFNSVQYIMRDVNFGWLIRDLHGASTTVLFGVVYLQIFYGISRGAHRGLPAVAWILVVLRLVAFLAVAYFGFAMVGGAGSLGSLSGVAQHLAVLPIIGPGLATALRGGYSVGVTTLSRVAMAHMAIGFLLVAVAVFTMTVRHVSRGGDNGKRKDGAVQRTHYNRNLFSGVILLAFACAALVTFAPGLGSTRLNAIPPDPLAIPLQVTLPWYLLAFQGLASAAQNVRGGAYLVIGSVLLLGAMPWLDRTRDRSVKTGPVFRSFVWLFGLDFIILSVAAAEPAYRFSPIIADLATLYWFAFLVVITPVVTLLEGNRTKGDGRLEH